MRNFYLVFYLIFTFACTNYSVNKSKSVPPILVSIGSIIDSDGNVISNAYSVKMRVTNQELFFAGYKLYVANSESAARNPSDLTSDPKPAN